MLTWLLLGGSAFLAGAINAIAGGGTLLTFPALVFTGTAPLPANATSTVALWPGAVASAWGYRGVFSEERRALVPLVAVSLVGGLVGALAALKTPGETFARLVPFLMLFAAVLFSVGDRLRAWLARFGAPRPWLVVLAQLPISLYGGYLGGGIGLLMLAAFTLLGGSRDLNRLNALKSVLGLAINLTATLTFVVSGLIDWERAVVMAAAAAAGGYLAARVALRVDVRAVKRLVVAIAWVMTALIFVKTFLPAPRPSAGQVVPRPVRGA
ncbi:MAG: sulfite exporter TauE/SafE family protein [Myxococcaceae bacterium]|nr:sulfite exporter TauE/SafE family protein [Myxococcaceae bacterium]